VPAFAIFNFQLFNLNISQPNFEPKIKMQKVFNLHYLFALLKFGS